jgi:hypothetical protein
MATPSRVSRAYDWLVALSCQRLGEIHTLLQHDRGRADTHQGTGHVHTGSGDSAGKALLHIGRRWDNCRDHGCRQLYAKVQLS